MVDTGTTNADDTTLVGLEAIWSRGSLGVTSEIIGSRVDEEDAGGASHLWGGYASVQNILTGQVLPFDSSVGTFRSIKPRRPFTLGKGGRGPGKSARGFSTLDLNDGPVRGGKMVILKGGLNWHWNKHTMWMLNLGVAEPRTATENGYVLIGRARFKVRY